MVEVFRVGASLPSCEENSESAGICVPAASLLLAQALHPGCTWPSWASPHSLAPPHSGSQFLPALARVLPGCFSGAPCCSLSFCGFSSAPACPWDPILPLPARSPM